MHVGAVAFCVCIARRRDATGRGALGGFCTSTLVSRVDGWRQKCKARPRREHVSCVSIVTKRQKSTIVSGMVVGAVAEAMKGAVVVAEAVVVVGVVAGPGIMEVAGILNRR